MNLMLLGAVAMSCFIASMFFARFWKTTRDRFFLFFAASFFFEGCIRIIQGWSPYSNEYEPLLYLIRLFAYLIIIFAIIDKNRMKNHKSKNLKESEQE